MTEIRYSSRVGVTKASRYSSRVGVSTLTPEYFWSNFGVMMSKCTYIVNFEKETI